MVDPDGAEADKPQEQFSVQLSVADATLVAVVRGPGRGRAPRPAAAGAAGPGRVRRSSRSSWTCPPRTWIGDRPAVSPTVTRDGDRTVLVDGLAHGRARRSSTSRRAGRCPTPSARLSPTPVPFSCRLPAGVGDRRRRSGRGRRDAVPWPAIPPTFRSCRRCRATCCWSNAAPSSSPCAPPDPGPASRHAPARVATNWRASRYKLARESTRTDASAALHQPGDAEPHHDERAEPGCDSRAEHVDSSVHPHLSRYRHDRCDAVRRRACSVPGPGSPVRSA